MIDNINKFRLDNKITYVIGGNGLIGSKILDVLDELNAKVTIFSLSDSNIKKLIILMF